MKHQNTRWWGLSTIGNLAIPLLGIYSARDDSPENYKSLRVCALYWVLGAVYYFFEAFLGLCLRSLLSGSLKAVVYGLQWLVLARLWRWMQVRYVGTVKFYLNIVIKNKQEAVQAKSMEKSRIAGKLLGPGLSSPSLSEFFRHSKGAIYIRSTQCCSF